MNQQEVKMGRGGVVERKVCVALAAHSGSLSIYVCHTPVTAFHVYLHSILPQTVIVHELGLCWVLWMGVGEQPCPTPMEACLLGLWRRLNELIFDYRLAHCLA